MAVKLEPKLFNNEVISVPFGPREDPAKQTSLLDPPPLPAFTRTSRPCGPFLYDLLPAPAAESTESTVVPKEDEWAAAHQEEEIFEIANMLDEDKVIAALWSRWMFVNRASFLANRYTGVLGFVENNGPMIQRAAGRKALRAFLLVLHSHRYLHTTEVAELLRAYDRTVRIRS